MTDEQRERLNRHRASHGVPPCAINEDNVDGRGGWG